MANATFEKFIGQVKQYRTLQSTAAVLHWDQETYMPPKAAATRADQLALLSGMVHERMVSDEMGELLDKLAGDRGLSEDEKACVREVRRAFDRERKLPKELVEELTKAQSLGQDAWVKARKASDFSQFAPWLETLVKLRRRSAKLIGGESANLYDTFLDEYEPGAKVAEIEPVFEALKNELVPLVAKIGASKRKPGPLTGHFATSKQREFGLSVARAMGFDFEAGRLDTSAHPFCTSFGPRDVRLTTRYDETDFTGALFGTMHEAGHGLYEQGFNAEHAFTPLAEATSMGIHESQSRLWENLVGRSRSFWKHFYPKLQDTFPEALRAVAFDDFYGGINIVEPSLIRVEADEVTYNLHILLRFELEQALVGDEISVSALPSLWNRKMEDYFGIKPSKDSEGVLQDVHWSMGAFGYFPTYTLGNLYAAQLFAAAGRDLGDLEGRLAKGELLPLRQWLGEKVHRHGAKYRANELCRMATGEALNPTHFTRHLKSKFGEIYSL